MKKVFYPPVVKRAQKDYSLSFKLQVIAEYEQGELGISAEVDKLITKVVIHLQPNKIYH